MTKKPLVPGMVDHPSEQTTIHAEASEDGTRVDIVIKSLDGKQLVAVQVGALLLDYVRDTWIKVSGGTCRERKGGFYEAPDRSGH